MFIESSFWKLILSYASCVCLFSLWYWLPLYFGIKRNDKDGIETFSFFNKFLVRTSLFIFVVPCIILFIIKLNNRHLLDDLWEPIAYYFSNDINKLLILFALSVLFSFLVICFFYGEHPFRNGEWKTYLTLVYIFIPIIFLILILIFNFNLITFLIIFGIFGLIISGKIIGL